MGHPWLIVVLSLGAAFVFACLPAHHLGDSRRLEQRENQQQSARGRHASLVARGSLEAAGVCIEGS